MSAEILEKLKKSVIEYDEQAVIQVANEVIATGMDAFEAVFNGLVPGMEEVGRLYEEQEYFVPEMLMCADALYAGLNILKPHIKNRNLGFKGQIVMGVVQGDVHDIGKNIVKMMFEVTGFKVHDLGRDVPKEKFLEEHIRTDSDLICISAMMTNTMIEMQQIIKLIKEKNQHAKIMVGGAPVTNNIATKWGADGYAKDANNALKAAIQLISSLKNIVAHNN